MDLNLIPVDPPPPGQVSNFIDPPTLMSQVFVGTIVIQAIVLPFILLRIFVNAVSRTFRIEDAFCYMAWMAMIVQAGLVIDASQHGGARDSWNISLAQVGRVIHHYNHVLIAWTLSGYFGRVLVFLQFKRIFTASGIRGPIYWVIMISILANTILYTTFLFSYVFLCVPREKIWNPMVKGRCLSTPKLQLATGVLNVVSDVEAFIVPVWAIWQLQMKLQYKFQVLAIFSVGIIAVGTATIGLIFRIQIQMQVNFTRKLTEIAIVCMAELASIIIVGCAPYLPRLRRWKEERGKSKYSASYNSGDSSNEKQIWARSSRPKSDATSELGLTEEEVSPRSDAFKVHTFEKDQTRIEVSNGSVESEAQKAVEARNTQ